MSFAPADAAARLQLVLTASEVGTWLWDVVHDRVEADANLARMFGVSAEEASGAPLAVYLRTTHPEDRPKVTETIARSLADGTPYEIEYRLLKPDGSVRWVLARGRVEYDTDGRAAGLPGVVLDITDRHLLTDKVAQQARIFDTTLSSITDFAYIFDKAGRFAYVNQALLSLWGLPLEDAVGKNFFDLHYPDALATKLQRQIQHVFDTVWGDANRLQQVIWNLLSNATKFTPKGGTIEVIQQRVGSALEVTVRDNGQGIDPSFLPMVFDRFRQSDASTTRTHGGLGLGLAIVKTLVELHGGRVMATSAGLGRGSAFTVSLPQTISEPSPHVSREVPAARAVHDPPPMSIAPELLRNVQVLVVDDNADGREVIARILREAGADVALASSATTALELFACDPPEVLLSDIGMPDIDGYELMRRIRAQVPGPKGPVPAAALTALARSEDRTRALLAGYQTHIAKPVDATELIAAVASLVGRTGVN